MKFSDIESAFEFVSSAPQCSNSALVSLKTGETFFQSDLSGEDDFPEDADENPDLLEVPHKHDLDCGQALVWQFVKQSLPEEQDRIRGYFSRRGGYARFKKFLDERRMLGKWYEFEGSKTQAALREWCQDVGIVLDD